MRNRVIAVQCNALDLKKVFCKKMTGRFKPSPRGSQIVAREHLEKGPRNLRVEEINDKQNRRSDAPQSSFYNAVMGPTLPSPAQSTPPQGYLLFTQLLVVVHRPHDPAKNKEAGNNHRRKNSNVDARKIVEI